MEGIVEGVHAGDTIVPPQRGSILKWICDE